MIIGRNWEVRLMAYIRLRALRLLGSLVGLSGNRSCCGDRCAGGCPGTLSDTSAGKWGYQD